jgi:segregation and condensation protein B
MSPTPDPPFESQPQGISLDELAEAFAQVMGVEPRRPAESKAAGAGAAADDPDDSPETRSALDAGAPSALTAETPAPQPAEQEDLCPISPPAIFEAMLFVGNRENRPLTPARAAELMRDVGPDEVPSLVDELNGRYAARGAPYEILGEGDGYRLALREEFRSLRDRFYGRIREARLSQAAIDVLALAAYQQPITADKIGRLRGKPSNHVLAHLVHRGLLRIERPDPKKRTPHYRTTERFLKLFGLETLDDLPRSEDAGPP